MPRDHLDHTNSPEDHFLERLEGTLLPVERWGTFRRGARHAAVNSILFHRGKEWKLPFVLRSPDLRSHPGQVGLPGGRVDRAVGRTSRAARNRGGDRSPGRRAAPAGQRRPRLHRGHELQRGGLREPHLAEPPARFTWPAGELVGVIEVPLSLLLEPGAWSHHGPYFGPQLRTAEGPVIWGLTAAILRGDLLPRLRTALTG